MHLGKKTVAIGGYDSSKDGKARATMFQSLPELNSRCSHVVLRAERRNSAFAGASLEQVWSTRTVKARNEVATSCASVSEHVTSNSNALTTNETVGYRFLIPEFVTKPGEDLWIVGSLPELGGWELDGGMKMTWGEGHKWLLELRLPRMPFEFKVVVVDESGGFQRWEQAANRAVNVGQNSDSLPVDILVQLWFDVRQKDKPWTFTERGC
eukprot:gene26314-17408_t